MISFKFEWINDYSLSYISTIILHLIGVVVKYDIDFMLLFDDVDFDSCPIVVVAYDFCLQYFKLVILFLIINSIT